MAIEILDDSTDRAQVILLLILSVSMVSSASILIRFSQSDPLAIVFWRTLYGSMVMALLGFLKGDHKKYDSVKLHSNRLWLVGIGLVLSLHFSTWFMSLQKTTVAASVVLVNTSPIFTALMSTLILKEALTSRSWVGIVIAIIGAILLSWNDLVESGIGALEGDILALMGALFLAIYFIGGRRYAIGLPITIYTSIVYLAAAAFTLVYCLVLGVHVLVLNPIEMLIFIALAIFPTALGHSVNNYLLTLVPAYVVSAAVLGEPIGATILAAHFLGEVPSINILFGFVIILIGIALVLTDLARFSKTSKSAFDNSNGS